MSRKDSKMSLDILCTPFFNATEEKEITAAAAMDADGTKAND